MGCFAFKYVDPIISCDSLNLIWKLYIVFLFSVVIFMGTAGQCGKCKEELFSSKLMSLQSVGFELFVDLSVHYELVWDTCLFID